MKAKLSTVQETYKLPSLGKLYCTRDRYLRVKKRFEYINNLREKDVKS